MRKADAADLADIMAALVKMLTYSPAPQMKFASVPAARRSVKQAMAEGRAYVVDGYFVMVDVGSDWYSEHTYLIEQIILRVFVSANHDVSIPIRALDDIAKEHGCALIAAGDTQVGYMTPFYHAAGYKTIGTQLMKESYGIRPEDHGGSGAD